MSLWWTKLSKNEKIQIGGVKDKDSVPPETLPVSVFPQIVQDPIWHRFSFVSYLLVLSEGNRYGGGFPPPPPLQPISAAEKSKPDKIFMESLFYGMGDPIKFHFLCEESNEGQDL